MTLPASTIINPPRTASLRTLRRSPWRPFPSSSCVVASESSCRSWRTMGRATEKRRVRPFASECDRRSTADFAARTRPSRSGRRAPRRFVPRAPRDPPRGTRASPPARSRDRRRSRPVVGQLLRGGDSRCPMAANSRSSSSIIRFACSSCAVAAVASRIDVTVLRAAWFFSCNARCWATRAATSCRRRSSASAVCVACSSCALCGVALVRQRLELRPQLGELGLELVELLRSSSCTANSAPTSGCTSPPNQQVGCRR